MNHELTWLENDTKIAKTWVSESHFSPPKQIIIGDDTLKADDFYRMASQGAAYIYRGDFQNAKQLMQAVQRRIDKSAKGKTVDDFHRHRQTQAHRAQLLARLLIYIEPDLTISLGRAPKVALAIREAIGDKVADLSGFVVSLRELLGFIGAHEWRKKGVHVDSLAAVIHPHYGLFSPGRGEYLDLVATAPLPEKIEQAFDVGTGTGVIAAILAKRGVPKIIATDLDDRALICASENISKLGYSAQIEIKKADLFISGVAQLIVCNPPWVPARPTSPIEHAIYDEESRMLRSFLSGVRNHLSDHGEVWLIMSDLAELLGLRKPDDLATWIDHGGIRVVGSLKAQPKHKKAQDMSDPLYAARSREVTSLWRLVKK